MATLFGVIAIVLFTASFSNMREIDRQNAEALSQRILLGAAANAGTVPALVPAGAAVFPPSNGTRLIGQHLGLWELRQPLVLQ